MSVNETLDGVSKSLSTIIKQMKDVGTHQESAAKSAKTYQSNISEANKALEKVLSTLKSIAATQEKITKNSASLKGLVSVGGVGTAAATGANPFRFSGSDGATNDPNGPFMGNAAGTPSLGGIPIGAMGMPIPSFGPLGAMPGIPRAGGGLGNAGTSPAGLADLALLGATVGVGTTNNGMGMPTAEFGGKGGLGTTIAKGALKGLGVAALAGASFLWNGMPGAADYAGLQGPLFQASFFGNSGAYNDRRTMSRIRANFGTGASGTFDTATAAYAMTMAGFGEQTSSYNQIQREAATQFKLTGMNNVAAVQGLMALQQPTVANRLATVGLSANSLSTNNYGGINALVDQIWQRSIGNQKLTMAELDAEISQGFLGAGLRSAFGDNPALYEMAISRLKLRVKNGSRPIAGMSEADMQAFSERQGNNAINNPFVGVGNVAGSRIGAVDANRDTGNAGRAAGQTGVMAINKWFEGMGVRTDAIGGFIDQFNQSKSAVQTFGSTTEGAAAMSSAAMVLAPLLAGLTDITSQILGLLTAWAAAKGIKGFGVRSGGGVDGKGGGVKRGVGRGEGGVEAGSGVPKGSNSRPGWGSGMRGVGGAAAALAVGVGLTYAADKFLPEGPLKDSVLGENMPDAEDAGDYVRIPSWSSGGDLVQVEAKFSKDPKKFNETQKQLRDYFDGLRSPWQDFAGDRGLWGGVPDMSYEDAVAILGSWGITPEQKARGGHMGSSTSDSIPAMLSKGEYVINARAAARIGRANLDALNASGHALGSAYASPAGTLPGSGLFPMRRSNGGTTISGNPALAAGSPDLTTVSVAGGKSITVAKQAANVFQQLLSAWQADPNLGGGRLSLSDGLLGSYAYRQARAASGTSDHAGWAIDVRYDILKADNQRHMTDAEQAAVRRILASLGGQLGWGGDYQSFVDEMHFYYKPNGGAYQPSVGGDDQNGKSGDSTVEAAVASLAQRFAGNASTADIIGVGRNGFEVRSLGLGEMYAPSKVTTNAIQPSVIMNTGGSNTGPTDVGSGAGPVWLAKFLYSKGARGEVLKSLWALAMRESGGRPNVDNAGLNKNGSIDYGLWQINSIHEPWLKKTFGWTMEDMRDPEKNFRAMWRMSQKGTNLTSWNIGPGAYNPETSAQHTEAWQRYMGDFEKYAHSAGLPGYQSGLARVNGDQNVRVHDGEMILPSGSAEEFRAAIRGAFESHSVRTPVNITLKIEKASDEEAVRFAHRVKELMEADTRMKKVRSR